MPSTNILVQTAFYYGIVITNEAIARVVQNRRPRKKQKTKTGTREKPTKAEILDYVDEIRSTVADKFDGQLEHTDHGDKWVFFNNVGGFGMMNCGSQEFDIEKKWFEHSEGDEMAFEYIANEFESKQQPKLWTFTEVSEFEFDETRVDHTITNS